MKKRILTITIALLLILLLPAPALAYEPWDVEDPCVAANEDFWVGGGYSGGGIGQGGYEQHSGAQKPGKPDGYNLYRDDASDSGLVDYAFVITLTPGEIDLPNISPIGKSGMWWADDTSSNAYYWAIEPRGYNLPTPVASEAYNRYKGLSGVFWVEVLNFSGFDTYKWDEWGSFNRVLADPVVAFNRVNGLICTLYIPEGTHLSYPNRPYTLVTNLFVEKDDSGGVYFEPGNMDFSQPCTLTLTHQDWAERITFTQIRGGLPAE